MPSRRPQLDRRRAASARFAAIKDVLADFTRTKTKAELFTAGLDHNPLIAPVATIEDVVASEQLAARTYFQPIEHPELGATVAYPGPFARFSRSPIAYRRRPPRIGEHTEEVLKEVHGLPVPGPRSEVHGSSVPTGDHEPGTEQTTGRSELPLSGVKILDFMWAIAGPAATRLLADFGATVVRISGALG